MRKLWFAMLPFVALACFNASDTERTDDLQESLEKRRVADADGVHDCDDPGHNPCDLVLCAPNHYCELDCDGGAVCNPDACETLLGLQCSEGFTCELEDPMIPDLGGKCARDDCGESCGACTNDMDCGADEYCTTNNGACEQWCDCPMCDVCAGSCEKRDDPACGECTSDSDCGMGEECTVKYGDCDVSCDCPMCAVCAGSCIPAM